MGQHWELYAILQFVPLFCLPLTIPLDVFFLQQYVILPSLPPFVLDVIRRLFDFLRPPHRVRLFERFLRDGIYNNILENKLINDLNNYRVLFI